jgi:hypothetical protein
MAETPNVNPAPSPNPAPGPNPTAAAEDNPGFFQEDNGTFSSIRRRVNRVRSFFLHRNGVSFLVGLGDVAAFIAFGAL